MLALLVASSVWRGHAWWEAPNLLGATLYGGRVFRAGANLATVTGSALQLAVSGVVGAVFGLVSANVLSTRRMVLLGTLSGLVWYYLAFSWLWTRINPLMVRYSPQPITILSYVLFGACLGYLSRPRRPPIASGDLRAGDPPGAGPKDNAVE